MRYVVSASQRNKTYRIFFSINNEDHIIIYAVGCHDDGMR